MLQDCYTATEKDECRLRVEGWETLAAKRQERNVWNNGNILNLDFGDGCNEHLK